jgi:predicted secreted protein
MAASGVMTGNNGVLKIDNGSGTATAVGAVRNFTIEITSDTIETTRMGSDVRTYLKGLSSFSGSADIYFDPSEMPESTSSTTKILGLNPTLESIGSSPYTIELYLDGTTGNYNKFSGEVIITGFSINSTMDGMVEGSISFQGSGGVTYDLASA